MSAKVTLVVERGALPQEEFLFETHDTCLIGRMGDCRIVVPDDKSHNTISRYHCLFEFNPPDVRLRDFGSLHGTYINGELIGKRPEEMSAEEGRQLTYRQQDLKDGDRVRLANAVELRVRITQPAPNEKVDIPKHYGTRSRNPAVPPSEQLAGAGVLLSEAEKEAGAVERLRTLFPKYDVVSLIGIGGTNAEIYGAVHLETGARVAMKILTPSVAVREPMRREFEREVANWTVLDHPNIVRLHHSAYADGNFVQVMDWCEAGDLETLVQAEGPLPLERALHLIFPVLDALVYAHQAPVPNPYDTTDKTRRGVVHRDIKPLNIFLQRAGDKLVPRIGDFGMAKAFELAGLSGMTATNVQGGSPDFVSRVQLIHFKYAQPEVDVWAAAATLYFLLTGQPPRDFSGYEDPFDAVLKTNPIPIRQRDYKIPTDIATVLDRALVDKPEIGIKTATALRDALAKAAGWRW